MTLFWFASIANLLASVGFLIWGLKMRSLCTLFWVGLLYSYSLPVLTDGVDSVYSPETLTNSAVFAFGFDICLGLSLVVLYKILGIHALRDGAPAPLKTSNLTERKRNHYPPLGLLTFTTGAAMVYWAQIEAHGSVLDLTWDQTNGGSNSYLYSTGLALVLGTGGFGAVLWRRRSRRLLATFAVVWLLLVLLLRVRVLLVPVIVPGLALALRSRRLKIRQFVAAGLVALVFIFAMAFVRSVRWGGTLTYDHSMIDRAIDMAIGDKMDNYVRRDYYDLLETFPTIYPFLNGSTFVRVALLPLPTSLFPTTKPPDSMYIYAGFKSTSTMASSVHPLVLGDAYANFGSAGQFLGIGYALCLALLEKQIRKLDGEAAIAALGPASVFLTLLVRGSVYNAFLFLVVGNIILRIIKFTETLVDRRSNGATQSLGPITPRALITRAGSW